MSQITATFIEAKRWRRQLMAKANVDAALLAEVEQDMQAPAPSDKLEIIRDKISEVRDLDYQILSLETQLSEMKRARRDLIFDKLPSMFMQIGLNHIGIAAKGNLPAYDAKLTDHI